MTGLGKIVVVGASLAGLRAVEFIRRAKFAGELVLVGDEPHLPYDRPPLSKQVLSGEWEPGRTQFRQKDGFDGLELDMRLGRDVPLRPRMRSREWPHDSQVRRGPQLP